MQNDSWGANAASFVRSLPRDFVVTATRSSLHRLFYQMVLPYLSVYTLALGATGTELGVVNFAGMAAAALLSPFTGWLLDRVGSKRVYLAGIALLALSWTLYAVAGSWPLLVVAMITYWIGYRTSGHSCGVICANSLSPERRATGMSMCETLAAGLLGMIGPVLGAFVVTRSGGMNANGIKPLFWLSVAGTALSFVLVASLLGDRRWGDHGRRKLDLAGDFRAVFGHGKHLGKLIVVSVVAQLPQGMIIPFTQPYAKLHGANELVLGAMVTGFALTPLVLGIPLGRLADRVGRKKVLFLVAPIFWISCLMLVFMRGDAPLVVAGILQGSFFVTGVITGAMQFEFVGAAYMGRWIGILGLFQTGVSALVALAAGFVWDRIGPEWVFVIPVALDILVRLPVLSRIPEAERPAAG